VQRSGAHRGATSRGPAAQSNCDPVQLHHKARCYTHTHGHLYHREGGGLGAQGYQARSHFRATRGFWRPIYEEAPPMPRPRTEATESVEAPGAAEATEATHECESGESQRKRAHTDSTSGLSGRESTLAR
jgi:hypothetical protein